MTKQKTILLCVTGGIAAYKACEVLRLFQKADFQVHVALTPEAEKFVSALTFQALSGHPVHNSLFDLSQESTMNHIELADKADAVLVCPATANTLAKMAHGLADDLVSTLLLATKALVFVAPSMNVNMWDHPATKANIETLKSRNVKIIEPESGELACGWIGLGRLAEPELIVQNVKKAL